MKLTYNAINLINVHAITAYPNECCGVIADGDYIPMANISQKPTTSFKISASEFVSISRTNKIQAIIHSHCINPLHSIEQDPRWASALDMETWIASDIPWGIIATNGTDVMPPLWYDDNDIKPLLGREFAHGITDCYAIVRDYYRQELKINLKNYVHQTYSRWL